MIIIVTPSLIPHDAVSNDVLQQRALLIAQGKPVVAYAELCHPSLTNLIATLDDVNKLVQMKNAVLIYHHSVHWVIGEEIILRSKCKVLMKYHNITPPEFFPNEPTLRAATSNGRLQTAKLISSQKFTKYIGDSQYNTNELIEAGAAVEDTAVIPPFHCVHDFDHTPLNMKLLKSLEDGKRHVLFVGRVVSNKGHRHLIKTISRYIDFYGSAIKLHIIGGLLNGDFSYLKELEDLVSDTGTADAIDFHDKINFSDLHTYYHGCHAFLLMSEHEGFCVPILEAQYHKLPIVALARGAVAETMGAKQIVFDEVDYDNFAVALHKVLTDQALRKSLQEVGYENFLKYESPKILDKTIEALHD